MKKAIAEGRPIDVHQRGRRPVLPPQASSTDDLLKMKRTPGGRPGAALPQGRPRRGPAARRWPTWPGSTSKTEPTVLIDAIAGQRRAARATRTRASSSTWSGCSPTAAPPSWPPSAASSSGWRPRRDLPVIRQLGYVALIAADGSRGQGLGAGARGRSSALRDLLGAMPLIRDPGLRASLYPKVEPLLHAPAARASSAAWKDDSDGEARGRHPPRGDERPDLRPRPGGARRSGPWPDSSASDVDRHAAILALQQDPRRLLAGRGGQAAAREPDRLRRAQMPDRRSGRRPRRSTRCSSATPWPRPCCRPTRPGRSARSWASWASG